jgi:hypothetical protein
VPKRRPPRFWLRLPRLVYWAIGAAVSFGGAAGARIFAETLPPGERVPVWLVGAVFVFIGLAVLSLGTKGRPEVEELFAENNGDRADGNRVNGDPDGPPPAAPSG